MASFAAVDFETARAGRDSACAVGVAVVDGGEIVVERGWLIRPPGNSYNGFNITIHGIRPSDTEHSPGFDRVWPEVAALIGSRLLVAHNTAFDMSVLQRSAAYWGYEPPPVTFLCSYRLCKSTWPNRWSYRLDDLAEAFGIPLDHHDYVSDAAAAARVALCLCRHHGVGSLEEVAELLGYRPGRLGGSRWVPFSNAKQHSGGGGKPGLGGLEAPGDTDPGHPLFGKKVVFTGTLGVATRAEAAQAAVGCGAKTSDSISPKTDYLVVGSTDLRRVGTDGMSHKMRKAVEIAEAGHDLEIIDETEFLQLLGREADRDRT